MTTDPTPDRNDPLRALDGVDPADNWDDVVSRSTDGDLLELAPVTARRSFPRPMLAAAAVLAVVALAAGVFAVTRGDDGKQNVAAEPDRDPGGYSSTTDLFWNSTWELVALERDGDPWDVVPNGETWPRLTTTQAGPQGIGYQACNQGTGVAIVEGDRLVVTELARTEMACMTEDGGTALMDQEEFVTGLLSDRPTIELTAAPIGDDATDSIGGKQGIGDQLVLSTDNGSATFERIAIGGPVDGGTDGNYPQAIWGRMWNVQAVTVDDGKAKFMVVPLDGSPLRLDASTDGRLSFNGCNGAGGAFHLEENRLVADEIGPSTLIGCEQALLDQDQWLQSFLEAEPIVTVSGNDLTLTTDTATMELEPADVVVGQPVEPEGPDEPVVIPPQPMTPVAEPPGPTTASPDPAFWNREWTVMKITDGGQDRAVVTPSDGKPLRFGTTTEDFTDDNPYEGSVYFTPCARSGGLATLDGDRLMVTPIGGRVTAVCATQALADQEQWLQAFLEAGPTIAIDGLDLTLTTDHAIIKLQACCDR